MQQNKFEQRFTDSEYLSKREITNVLGPSYVESAWRLTSDYREKYRFPLPLKRFDNFPFTIVLTPSIMAHANSAERKMFDYSLIFENYKVKESISDTKSLQKFKDDILKEDLLVLAHYADLEVGERDIDLMLEPHSLHLKDSHIFGFYEAIRYLNSEGITYGLSRNLVREIYNRIIHSEEKIIRYRSQETYSGDISSLNPQDIQGAPTNRIVEFMNRLFEFYEADYELSPFIIAAIVYAYILYIIPFDKFSHYVAIILVEKVLADSGYGEACYYTSLAQYLIKKEKKLKAAYENTRTSGDLTYVIIFLCDTFIEALNWKTTNIQTVEVPLPIRDEVKVVEKIVEVPVIKEVPVVKEVIKEVQVPVEKIVYINKPAEPVFSPVSEEKKEIPAETSPKEIETLIDMNEGETINVVHNEEEEEEVYHEYKKPEEKLRADYDFIEDPFAKQLKPVVDQRKVVEPVKKVEMAPVNTVNVEDISADVAKLLDLDADGIAKGLVELNPFIRYHQALFYANHHDVGRYYTIGQFKNFTGCAYETARTSMDFMTSLGLYRKEQIKNKFVYTPVDIKKEG